MQLQIEYNGYSLENQSCYLCKQQFKTRQARVIACNEQGEGYGEVCPHCIAKGFTWIENRFQRLVEPSKKPQNFICNSWGKRLDELVGATDRR